MLLSSPTPPVFCLDNFGVMPIATHTSSFYTLDSSQFGLNNSVTVGNSRGALNRSKTRLAEGLYSCRQWCIVLCKSLPSKQQLARAVMKKLCPICGPKMSVFCMIMSVWGVIFLGLLGVFFYMQAVTLFPDLPFTEEQEKSIATSTGIIEQKYSEKAVQCWIAAGLYLVTLIVVFWQNKFNTTQIF